MLGLTIEEIRSKLKSEFSLLRFDPIPHEYYIGKNPIRISMSAIASQYSYPTNWDEVLKTTAKKRNITPEELRKEWDRSAKEGQDKGNCAHNFGEDYVNSGFSLKPTTKNQEAIVKFWKDLPDFMVVVFLEKSLYHKELLFAGTFDILLYNLNTGKFTICDYKTDKDLFKNFRGNRMQEPFSTFLCTPAGGYAIQLSGYQLMLEQVEGVEVVGRKIIWLKGDGNYELFELEDLTKILYEDLKAKHNEIKRVHSKSDLCLL